MRVDKVPSPSLCGEDAETLKEEREPRIKLIIPDRLISFSSIDDSLNPELKSLESDTELMKECFEFLE
jgi:hypothetical protein